MFFRQGHSSSAYGLCILPTPHQGEINSPDLLLSAKKPSVAGLGEEQPPSHEIPLWCFSAGLWPPHDTGTSGGELVEKVKGGNTAAPVTGTEAAEVQVSLEKPCL